ncbi:MAG: hypothetical protein ACWGQW_00170 [bacterium]
MAQRHRDMIRRCYDPNHISYVNYGGRGITVCDRWLDPIKGLENFIVDMGFLRKTKQVDRINNDGPYSPENCRPVDRKTQSRNRRNAVFVTHGSITRQACEWDEINGWKSGTVAYRVSRGWSHERAVTHPVYPRRRKDVAND